MIEAGETPAVANRKAGPRQERPHRAQQTDHPRAAVARCRRADGLPTDADLDRNVDASSDRLGHCRSEEHTSELQSLMRISYAVFCLKKKIQKRTRQRIRSTHISKHNT